MNPRLVVMAGPSKGSIFALNEAEISIGREPSNQFCIVDLSISRQHCLIRREGEQFKLCDLESRNCTFVNGVPVKERLLEHGDLIAFGDSQLLFLLHDKGV